MTFHDMWPSATAWRRLSPLLVLMAAILLLFRDTVAAMVGIWDRSETFAHAFLVPPIVVWLVWRQRAVLAQLPSQPAWTALPLMAGAALLWLLGDMAGVNAATQWAVVSLLVLSVPAVYGWVLARTLTFPLLFLFFCVPIGEFMVPQMMDWTADFAAMAVRLSGIPIYREGLQFVIPTGNWSVVEACSGVRYLIASLMVGTLFAYLNYQSPRKRALFMLVSLLVPIVANWLRAYMIVMIGHLSGNKLAAGVDHIIYGWVFFGVVIGVMFMLGARWTDPEPPAPEVRTPAGAAPLVWGRAQCVVLATSLALLVGVQSLNWKLNQPQAAALPTLQLPSQAGAWQAQATAFTTWEPAYSNAVQTHAQTYGNGKALVGLNLLYYRDQGYTRKMVTSSNALADVEAKGQWMQTGSGSVHVAWAGGDLALRAGDLRGSAQPGAAQAQRLRVWQVYWVGGHWTTSDSVARLRLALNRLMGRGDNAAVLMFHTEVLAVGSSAEDADAVLAQWVPAVLPQVAAQLRASVGLP